MHIFQGCFFLIEEAYVRNVRGLHRDSIALYTLTHLSTAFFLWSIGNSVDSDHAAYNQGLFYSLSYLINVL